MAKSWLKELGLTESCIRRFKSVENARKYAASVRKGGMVALGDDGRYWVCSTNRTAGILKRAGFEVFPWWRI